MKSTAFVAIAGIAAAIFSIAAQAQTGRPSTLEVPAAADAPHAAAPGDQQLGSYGRYLMLNGATRANALVASRNIDRPADAVTARRLAASRVASRADAQAPARQ
jgi:hypothetical protein